MLQTITRPYGITDDLVPLEKLGEGSFGVVCKARNRRDNKLYAVKTVKFPLDEMQRQRFVRESELLEVARGHENIVYLYHSGLCDDRFIIIMEFCELGDLDRYVTTTNPSVDIKVRLMYDMSNGLDFLHQNNIIHRDMKPANVLVTSSQSHGRPVCKISDLGEAKMHAFAGQLSYMASYPLLSYLTSIHGTFAYIAPEVLQNHYTSSCDVFSLGVIFYALFSEYPQVPGMTKCLNPLVCGQYIYGASGCQIRNAVEGLQSLPPELRNLTLEMLKRDYHDRVECGTVKETLASYIRNQEEKQFLDSVINRQQWLTSTMLLYY